MVTRLSYLRLIELSALERKATFFSPLTFEPKSALCHDTQSESLRAKHEGQESDSWSKYTINVSI